MASTEGTTECVESVKFGFLSQEEVRRMSMVKITNPVLVDKLERPVEGGLYDRKMGSLDDRDSCVACDQRSYLCPGHCGHIELVSPVYNPLVFRNLFSLLQKSCLYCHKFRESEQQVKLCTSKLELILKGDIVGAKRLDLMSESISEENSEVHVDGAIQCSDANDCHVKHSQHQKWTSIQFKESMSVLDEFMKKREKKCKRCGAKNPTITAPTFGWIKTNLSSITARGNAIASHKLQSHSKKEAKQRARIVDSDAESSGAVYDEILDPAIKSPLDLHESQLNAVPSFPHEFKRHMELLWENESQLCSIICDIQQERLCMSEKKMSCSMFFIESLLVPPIKFRAPTRGGDSVTVHPQTHLLAKILETNINLGNALKNSNLNKVVPTWMGLQQFVNLLFGNKKTMGQKDKVTIGVCQILEKKEGVFRQKMMGKRVNYACRSVISPDPYLTVNEIGIPPYFALRLTYPERVTPWNADKLRKAILNGPGVHPGATHYTDKLTTVKLPVNRKTRTAISKKLSSSIGGVSQVGKSVGYELEGKVVYRHLQDGDIVLVNRQPTLHKASIMAHVVRVLKGEKTLRMHYANCSSYNADFDGDEMNVHFPQDEISRAEAFNIVNANNQYIIPTSGDTRRGLIQDHIVSAVLLTKKDTFLTRDEYNHLLYSSGVSTAIRNSMIGNFGKRVSVINSEDEIQPVLPAIWKPEPLWTGKQIITSLLNHMSRTKGFPPLTVEKRATIPSKYFGGSSEGDLVVQKNEFVTGVIDKAQFGKYGLVHTVQEFYGPDTAGTLLSALSRLFTVFLQMHGFTCGVDDLLLEQKVDIARRELLEEAKSIGEAVYFDFVNGKNENENMDRGKTNKSVKNKAGDTTDKQIDPVKLQMDVERAVRVNGESAISILDTKMASAINELTSKVNNDVISLPKGLLKPFPGNCFLLMTISGAKGGQVNFTQISSLLGQQSLEGKRVPLMISGKTLPCFPPWEPAPRAGGFISDCFLTGLRPQEYYFHCMAGREGLVDTAVKTSRSGYLQRCLIKNLECLKVGYDHTVRDADGSVVQFCYGEDGVDVHKKSFMTEFDKLASNQKAVLQRHSDQYEDALFEKSDSFIEDLPEALKQSAKKFISELPKKQRASLNLKTRKDFMNLVKLKYHSSLAQSGEPVGVIAAQSVGEPSTQMTLNTFHHAGQKESNVTLGIPRLQEILTRASENMRTPIMECPFQEGKTKDDAQRLAETFRKVSVADVVENIEVRVVPFSVQKNQVSCIYQLKMKLFQPELYPPFSNIMLEDCMETLEVLFVEELAKAIENHLVMLNRIRGIMNIVQRTESGVTGQEDEADPGSKSEKVGDENEDHDDDDEEGDLDTDAKKRRHQSTDEIEYEDADEYEEDPSTGFGSDTDELGVEDENLEDDNITDRETQILDAEDEPKFESSLKSEPTEKDLNPGHRKTVRKSQYTDRVFFVDSNGLDFEVHLRSMNEPHILLSQIAHKTAKNVYIKRSGTIDECSVATVKDFIVDNGSLVEKECQGLRTSGVNFGAFWDRQDDLDVRKIYTNDIHAMLRTYGVEAARAAFIKEVKAVFDTHGASVDIRHLSLIADFMTHSGEYRPMSRHGMAVSTSPLSKMSFETASNFIKEAAYHGLVDDLESPSARICLGLPVKMGTGSFDLMQKVQF